MFEFNNFSLEVHVLYMGKRVPKLCRMKRLSISQ